MIALVARMPNNTVLNERGASGHPPLVPALSVRAFRFSPSSDYCGCGFVISGFSSVQVSSLLTACGRGFLRCLIVCLFWFVLHPERMDGGRAKCLLGLN